MLQITDKHYHIMSYASPWSIFELTISVVIGIDCIGIVVNPTTIRSWPRQSPFGKGSYHWCTCTYTHFNWMFWFSFMVFNATFNNISVISWWSVLLVEETGGAVENHRSVTSHYLVIRKVWRYQRSNQKP